MKLRIRGNSIRLRLGKSEVEHLGQFGHFEDGVAFGPLPSETLRYRLQSDGSENICAELRDGCITVHLPQKMVQEWIGGDEVSLKGSQPLEDSDELTILVEKDFACETRKDSEDEPDSFERPKEAAVC